MATLSKTESTLQAWTQVNADAQGLSATLDMSTKFRGFLCINHARLTASAQVGNGTEYLVQVARKSTPGDYDDDWQTVYTFESQIAAGATGTLTNTEAQGATVIETGGTAVKGDKVFIQNATLGNSERVDVIAVSAGVSFTISRGISQSGGQASGENWYNKAEDFSAPIDFTPKSVRVRVNNNKGTTNQNIAYRVSVITEDSLA